MALQAPAGGYTASWVNSVLPEGVFYKNKNATWSDTFGATAIPYGWTVKTI